MEKVLFNEWQVDRVSTMVLSCVGIFFMAVIYEGIKYYRYVCILINNNFFNFSVLWLTPAHYFRENLLWRTYNSLHYRAVNENAVPDAEHKT